MAPTISHDTKILLVVDRLYQSPKRDRIYKVCQQERLTGNCSDLKQSYKAELYPC